MKAYNGHRSWNAWNVSLWINNDYGLYVHAMDCVKNARSLRRAVLRFMHGVGDKTPDGAKYNFRSVKDTLQEYWDEKQVENVKNG